MAQFIPVDPFDLIIFGATGDLSKRKLLPALYHRWLDGQISEDCNIIGSSRTELDREGFQALARTACKTASGENWDKEAWEDFSKLLHYVPMDATDTKADWKSLKSLYGKDRCRIYYLATSPRLYVQIANALGTAKMNEDCARVVLEKPIGTDLASAKAINNGVGAVFKEEQIYRIDHYLGKETVQNLMVLRFANTLFEPIWNRTAIDHVQITVSESLGLEGRADYYDGSGALRDMVQNHLLQLLCLTALEPPSSMAGDDIRIEKIKVLKALKRFDAKAALKHSVRAQYTGGTVDGEKVMGYQDTLTSDEPSKTETFVAIEAKIDNWRWADVPFYLRTGKRMKSRHSDIVIQFRKTPLSIFGTPTRHANKLVLRLQPDEGVQLFVQIKEPGPGGMRIKSLPLNLSYADNFTVRYPDAYERLLMDVVRGNLSLFMRKEEVEAAWEWVDGLLAAWEESDAPLETYAAGTDGPTGANKLLWQNGNNWWESDT